MEAERLAQLGLTVQEGAAGLEVVLQLQRTVREPADPAGPCPPSPSPSPRSCSFRWIPPELVGLPPLAVDDADEAAELEARLLAGSTSTSPGSRRWPPELEALGLQPCVDPGSLEVHAETQVGGYRVILGADKQGKLRILEVHRAGLLLRSEVGAPFAIVRVPRRHRAAGASPRPPR